jgi:hypothetical protein
MNATVIDFAVERRRRLLHLVPEEVYELPGGKTITASEAREILRLLPIPTGRELASLVETMKED